MAIKELHEQLVSKKIGAAELCKSYLDKIAASDSEINSYITVCADGALAQAEAAPGGYRLR